MLSTNILATETLPEQELLDFVLSKGYLTGSRAWDVHNGASDYDYVLYGEDFHSIKKRIQDSNNIQHELSGYFNGMYFVVDNKVYNIFTHIKDEVEYIKQTTEIMKSFPKEKLSNKNSRVYIFETLRAMMKGIK